MPTIADKRAGETKESAVESKKIKHKKNILKYLYFEKKKSIAELSEALFISIPTLTSHVEELLEEKWLIGEEVDTKKQGRNPTIYSLDPRYKHVLVVDVTTHDTRAVLLNFRNEIIEEQIFELGVTNDQGFRSQILEIINDCLYRFSERNVEVVAVGLTFPGLINKQTGQNRTYVGLNSENTTLSEVISSQWNVPVYVLNDSKATVFGESVFGVGKDEQHVLSINVDWGVGLAVVINGQIFNGASGFAGELGHVQVNPEGELCSCGKIGCLDTVASASSLLNKVKKGLSNGVVSSLSKYRDKPEEITLEKVIDAAANGDGFSIDTLYNIGLELGKGLSVAVHLFNPQIIVIDGVLSKAGNLIVNPVEFAINRYCLPDFKEGLMIKVTELGDTAKILGMNAFVAKRLFKNE
ncbi:ROK family transcriptional regulator [Leadbetterella byssophila]|uniref:ROK family transcriptional regulator n=1 Tax=Leadbetterella byssophila TaxID=316068 RepID=UPI00399F61C0